MAIFFKKSSKQNYDVWSGYSWHVPGVGGMFTMLGMLLFGGILGNIATLLLMPLGADFASQYGTVIAYPIMFIPPMLYSKLRSSRNEMFENGYALDSNNFHPINAWLLGLLCIIATLALSFNLDFVNSLMPAMPEFLEQLMKSMTQGNFWINFLSVSIFAPLFEEWLCRGIVLRGLLNHKKEDGRQMKPCAAIIVSALFFAVIHLNPWQAIPAFAIGCLMGYVYYKTGSLKLTMLMHFANNTFALIIGQSESLKDYDNWMEILPAHLYWIIFVAALLFIVLFVRTVARVKLDRPSGNSDEIPVESVSL